MALRGMMDFGEQKIMCGFPYIEGHCNFFFNLYRALVLVYMNTFEKGNNSVTSNKKYG